MIDFPYTEALDALRAVVKRAFDLPDETPIPESGDQDVDLVLPMASLESAGEATINDVGSGEQWGRATKNLSSILPFRVWYFCERASMAEMRSKLRALKQALIEDRTLGGTVTLVRLTGTNTGGVGQTWPFEMTSDEGAMAGYVGMELHITEEF